MRKHEACAETQCHVTDHCAVCSQRTPCDASILAAALLALTDDVATALELAESKARRG